MPSESDQTQVDTTATAITIPNGLGLLYLDPTTLVASKSVTMPPNPSDQMRFRVCVGGQITSGTVFTLLTFVANTGQTLIGSASGLFVAGQSILWIWRNATNQWYRIQ